LQENAAAIHFEIATRITVAAGRQIRGHTQRREFRRRPG
jgi:hypothetical protein